MFTSKIIKICQSFFKRQSIMLRCFWCISVHFNSYFVGSVFPG